ncbi:MAG: hypothetical protein A3J93_04360 [Candidatus Magasanikbacteria bacterium RIFOXYC2_FULL_42_28]|uniref:Cell division protein FtsL n=1 Tax=Candidatus Magasanikbacteria bacterium RIFOXYC2_FULL_42_28 TaxID=1798704 RepID=A0A1F6NX68_9BACT|nr:MAG: hypothetical protein A3J93_04360 [Candidatus Magasanikbacteria bacterium RIFOXYC2_FULL_42_28]
MTLKHQIQNHYSGLIDSLTSIDTPSWLSGLGARVSLVMCVAMFGILYLFQTGDTAAAGYQIHDLERQSTDLVDEIKNLEVTVADYSSLVYIKKRVPELNMVAVAQVKHLTPVGAVVALR